MFAAVLPVQVACTNCNGVGYFEVPCPRCEGRGWISPPKSTKLNMAAVHRMGQQLPCPDCFRGMSSKDKRGTGKKKITCKVCHGKKKIRR